jgi:hypothetical protein
MFDSLTVPSYQLLEKAGNYPLALFESTKHKSQPTPDDSWLLHQTKLLLAFTF